MFGAFLAVIGWDIRPNFKENLKPCAQLYASGGWTGGFGFCEKFLRGLCPDFFYENFVRTS